MVVLNAGIGERGDLFDPALPRHASEGGWQATLDIDLTAVITGLRCGSRCGSQNDHGDRRSLDDGNAPLVRDGQLDGRTSQWDSPTDEMSGAPRASWRGLEEAVRLCQ